MGFKTNRKTGNVFNDNKQRSDKHHGSVKPTGGIKLKPFMDTQGVERKYPTQYEAQRLLDLTDGLAGIPKELAGDSVEFYEALSKIDKIRMDQWDRVFGEHSPWRAKIGKNNKRLLEWDEQKANALGLN